MALTGDLASVDLAQVFQMLALNQKVGLLSIQGPRVWRALYFEARGVTLYYNEHTLLDRALNQLVRSSVLNEHAITDARDHAVRNNGSVVDSLLAGGYLDEAVLDQALRTQIEEEIYDVFFWKDAQFEFFEGASTFEGREGVVNERFFFSTDSMIMEAARRIDEWSFIRERVPTSLEIYEVVERGGNATEVDDSALALLDLVDGRRNVARLVEITGHSPFHVYKSLAQLLDQGLVQNVPNDALVAQAQACVAEGRQQDAINLYEKAIVEGVGVPETHALAAQAYESTQEYELAAYHYKCVAEHHIAAGDLQPAVEVLRYVGQLLPTDLGARERLLEIAIGARDVKLPEFDLVAEGKALVDLFLEIEEIERVRALLERLLRENPVDLELKRALVNVHTRAGDTRRVIELYESIADDLVKDSKPIEAVKYLQKILMIDRSRRDVSERIRSLYELDERRRSRRRLLVGLTVMLILLVGLGTGWWFYERHARGTFERIDVSEAIAAKDFQAAEDVYRAFMGNHPLTMVARDADAEIARIRKLRTQHELELEQARLAEQARINQVRAAYRREYDRYQAEANAGNLDGALLALENVKKMATDAGQETDRVWMLKVNLEGNLRAIRDHISESAAFEREARALLEAGDWRGARRTSLQLVTRFQQAAVTTGVRIPLMLVSRPAGARILRDGKPVRAGLAGDGPELTTPGLVFCESRGKPEYTLELDGFKPTTVAVDPRAADESTHVLEAIPERAFTFDQPLHTTVGVGAGFVAGGMRGGWFGVGRSDGTKPQATQKLPGLGEVYGRPSIWMDQIVFRTNENRVRCHQRTGAAPLWEHAPAAPMSADPLAVEGRVFVVDTDGRLTCLTLHRGEVVWTRELRGAPVAGAPAFATRFVRVGTAGGHVYVFDSADGTELAHHETGAAIATGVLPAGGLLLFGTNDGQVVAVQESSGRQVWRQQVGKPLRAGDLAVGPNAVYSPSEGDELVRFDLKTGKVAARHRLPGELRGEPVVAGGRVHVVAQESEAGKKPRDVMQALDATTLEVQWEYRDGGRFLGGLATDGGAVYLTGSNGEVVRFK
jgi:outer membrane protein assembly factor BamB/tetratricopeptide (TPR) repeat protein